MGSKSEARKEEIRLKVNAGALPRGTLAQSIILDDYFERYMGLYVEPGVAPNTIINCRYAYKVILGPHLGHLKLTAINHETCQRAINEALKNYAHSSVSAAKAVLSACLIRARISGLIVANPLTDVRMPRHQHTHARALTPAELNAFVKAALSSDKFLYGPLLAAAALTGMRRGELTKLKWKNVNFTAGVIRVREGGSRPNTKKSAAGRRDVAMPAALRDLLIARYEADRRQHQLIPSWNSEGLVFTNRKGGLINQSMNISRFIKKLMRIAGIYLPDFRLHDLRHSHGPLLVNAGAPITNVAARLGQVVQTTVKNLSAL